MEPTALQADELLRMAGPAGFIWNWASDDAKRSTKKSEG